MKNKKENTKNETNGPTCDAGAAVELIENSLANAYGGIVPITFNSSNGPISARWRRRRANKMVAPAMTRSTSATFGHLRWLEYRTKTPRDKSSVRSDRFGIDTQRLDSFCPVASASYLVHLVLFACERVYVRDSWIDRPVIDSDSESRESCSVSYSARKG